MSEERSILTQNLFLCGDCMVEEIHAPFRTDAYLDWLHGRLEGEAIMRKRLVRKADVSDDLVGCACCWSRGVNVAATFAIELTIDGDA